MTETSKQAKREKQILSFKGVNMLNNVEDKIPCVLIFNGVYFHITFTYFFYLFCAFAINASGMFLHKVSIISTKHT